MALKLAVVSAGLVLLCLHRDLRVSRLALLGVTAAYALVVVYHLAFLAHLTLNA
jgi:hypothetical protein